MIRKVLFLASVCILVTAQGQAQSKCESIVGRVVENQKAKQPKLQSYESFGNKVSSEDSREYLEIRNQIDELKAARHADYLQLRSQYAKLPEGNVIKIFDETIGPVVYDQPIRKLQDKLNEARFKYTRETGSWAGSVGSTAELVNLGIHHSKVKVFEVNNRSGFGPSGEMCQAYYDGNQLKHLQFNMSGLQELERNHIHMIINENCNVDEFYYPHIGRIPAQVCQDFPADEAYFGPMVGGNSYEFGPTCELQGGKFVPAKELKRPANTGTQTKEQPKNYKIVGYTAQACVCPSGDRIDPNSKTCLPTRRQGLTEPLRKLIEKNNGEVFPGLSTVYSSYRYRRIISEIRELCSNYKEFLEKTPRAKPVVSPAGSKAGSSSKAID